MTISDLWSNGDPCQPVYVARVFSHVTRKYDVSSLLTYVKAHVVSSIMGMFLVYIRTARSSLTFNKGMTDSVLTFGAKASDSIPSGGMDVCEWFGIPF
ncbi:hypothetical protein CEXT_246761 [Caerostris extrusa]|uniref:Uncharacterized protein n=1 Tax=Caerostris extrusa TaxID=172846 RepID=A0AAV4Y9U9_CAEEX|nr:hypothetical protein CEXT_246761 [Caerostris extrusa]